MPPKPTTRTLVGAALALGLGAAPAMAQKPKPTAPSKAARSTAVNALSPDDWARFLADYRRALVAGDRAFLAAHTHLPLPFATVGYDMESKAHGHKLKDADALVAAHEELAWPEALVAKDGAALGALRHGVEQCDKEGAAGDVPDFTRGEPAFAVHGAQATLRYLAEPCAAETHVVTLVFEAGPSGPRLVERKAKPGLN